MLQNGIKKTTQRDDHGSHPHRLSSVRPTTERAAKKGDRRMPNVLKGDYAEFRTKGGQHASMVE